MSTLNKVILTPEQVHQVIWSLVAENTGKAIEELTPKSRLLQDLGADSLDIAELAMELEEKLGIRLPEELLDNPELTLGELERALNSL
jgi:acyl carrier protein